MNENQSFFERNQLLIKGVLIGFLVLMLTIPTLFIQNLISERQTRKQTVLNEISQKWGRAQTLNGPVLRIPYYQREVLEVTGTNGKKTKQSSKVKTFKYITPNELNVNANINPQKRKRGIFEVVVYESDSKVKGSFKELQTVFKEISEEDILWNKAEIVFGLTDLRGIKDEIKLIVNDEPMEFTESLHVNEVFGDAVVAPIKLTTNLAEGVDFEIAILLKGSEYLNFVAIAKKNTVEVRSSWDSPSFSGAFLPDNREVKKGGFKAEWQISHLNRNLPESWEEEDFPSFENSSFGVSLINPNDNYQKSERSVKYAILIIGLTFLAFFFGEILKNQKVHAFQYILVGFALCIFYVLLVSISEVLTFNAAYIISGGMTLILTYLYSRSIFDLKGLASAVNLILAALYAFIFVIIQLEDTALLIGSLGLFFILAITMYVSRKVDWYGGKN